MRRDVRIAKEVASLYVRTAYRLSPSDKKVIEAFVMQREAHGKILITDGRILEKGGIGSERVARWRGSHIAILSSESVKSDEVILRYLEKVAGKNRVRYQYERDGRKPTLRLETGGDALYRGQWDGWITAYIPEETRPVGRLDWSEYQGEISIKHVEVDPRYQRQGIARAMYQKLFKDQGITKRDLGPSLRTDDGAAFRDKL